MRRTIALAGITMLMALVAVLVVGPASGSKQQTRATQAAKVLTFTGPVHVSSTLEGCRNDGSITFGLSGPFICPDAAYTTGNLGKGWNELDLVPFRLTTTLGNQDSATTDYNIMVAGDKQAGGATGWDVIPQPVVGTGEQGAPASDASCQITGSAFQVGPGLQGGADSSIYEVLSIHQAKGTTCLFNFYLRLALGSHLYPGSSLQAYLFQTPDFSGGAKTVPLPVNQISPQSLTKDMAATRDATTPWNLTKGALPTTVPFGNVCGAGFSNTASVNVTVTWTKLAAVPTGDVLLVTNIYANNPSARALTTTISDQMYTGTDHSSPLGSPYVVTKVVPAHTQLYKMGTHTQTVSSNATQFNDEATGTYVDTVTSIPIPGTTTATAQATVQTGTTLNATATISDSESITGSGLTFKVAAPSVGSFTGYTAGTYTVGPVVWGSGTQSGSNSVTFSKTIKLDPIQATTGTLSDSASLSGSNGLSVGPKTASVSISSTAYVKLTINKTIPDILQTGESQTFTFHVLNGSAVEVATPTITFGPGDTSKSVDVTGLDPGSYTVKEATATGWDAQSDKTASINLPSCSGSVSFANSVPAAHAQVRKVTDPAGYESGWVMTLNGPGASDVQVTTTGTGYVQFPTDLQEGSYTIAETQQSPWVQQASSGSCSFTVDYPGDSGKTFSCTMNNKDRGHVRLIKTLNGGALGSQSFAFQLRQGASTTSAGTVLESGVASAGNSGTISFATDLVPGTTYNLCEFLVATYGPGFPNGYGPYNPNDDASYLCFDFSLTVAQTASDPAATFTVDNSHQFTKALTIGYWKNWSGCSKSNGNQTDSLGPALGAGIALGPYTVTTECGAVNLLSKQNVEGQKQPGDPVYNMVAQLLGAKLNVANGAGSCSALGTALGQADGLLTAISFDGVKSYKKTLTQAQADQANSLAATLDQYNNNNLC